MFTKLTIAVLIVTLLGITILRNLLVMDPDLGWHLKTGELIATSGIPKSDPFSYTMPSFAYVDHSWLPDVFSYYLYKNLGFASLIFLYFVPTLAAIFIVTSLATNRSRKVVVLLLALTIFSSFTTTRPLAITWLLFSVVLGIIWTPSNWKKYKYFLPLIFIIWANSHGGFAIGLFLVLLKTVRDFTQKPKEIIVNIILTLLSVLATFINPYGLGLWKEVIDTITDSSLRSHIQEWLPGIITFDPALATLVTLTGALLWFFRNKFDILQKIVFIFCLISAITSHRNIPFLTLVSIPLLITEFNLFKNQAYSLPSGRSRLRKVYKVFFYLISFLCLGQLLLVIQSYSGQLANYYPSKAVDYLKTRPISGNIFAPYNWGGYLIWNYPEKKVFVDGRMPSWRQEKTTRESGNAFNEYLLIGSGQENYKDYFEKYQISTVLWFNKAPQTNLDTKVFNFLGLPPNKNASFSLTKQLTTDGWIKVYEDDTATIYFEPR